MTLPPTKHTRPLTRRQCLSLGIPFELRPRKPEPKPRREIAEVIGMSRDRWSELIRADVEKAEEQKRLEKIRQRELAAQERKANRRGRGKKYYQEFYGQSWWIVQAEAMDRAKGTCEICKSAPAVHVHHIIPIRYFLDSEDAHYINNTLAVCKDCHVEEHRQMKYRFPLFNHLKLALCKPGRLLLPDPAHLIDKTQ